MFRLVVVWRALGRGAQARRVEVAAGVLVSLVAGVGEAAVVGEVVGVRGAQRGPGVGLPVAAAAVLRAVGLGLMGLLRLLGPSGLLELAARC